MIRISEVTAIMHHRISNTFDTTIISIDKIIMIKEKRYEDYFGV